MNIVELNQRLCGKTFINDLRYRLSNDECLIKFVGHFGATFEKNEAAIFLEIRANKKYCFGKVLTTSGKSGWIVFVSIETFYQSFAERCL